MVRGVAPARAGRGYGRHTRLTCIGHYGFRFLGPYLGVVILADTVIGLPFCDTEKDLMLVLLGYFLIAATVILSENPRRIFKTSPSGKPAVRRRL